MRNSLTFHGIFHILGKKTPHHLRADLTNSKLLRKPEGTFQRGFGIYPSKGSLYTQYWTNLQAENLNITDTSFTQRNDQLDFGDHGLKCMAKIKQTENSFAVEIHFNSHPPWISPLEQTYTVIWRMWSQCTLHLFHFLVLFQLFFFFFLLFSLWLLGWWVSSNHVLMSC